MEASAKFKVSQVTHHLASEIYQEVTLDAICGTDGENASFSKYTPNGKIVFSLTNPALADTFKPGNVFYVDFTRTEA